MWAFVFPGQGAQVVGMGRDLAEAWPEARAVFEAVDEALGERLSALIWEGDIAELTLTANAQPALMATSIAAMRALAAEGVAVGSAAFVSTAFVAGWGQTSSGTPLPHLLPTRSSRSAAMVTKRKKFIEHATTFVTASPTVGMSANAESSVPLAAPNVFSA